MMADETAPNQGATGEATESLPAPAVGAAPPTAAQDTQAGPNQGATGDAPAAAARADAPTATGPPPEPPPPPEPEAPPPGGGESPLAAQREAAAGVLDEHPEILVGASFLGGLVVAKLLKRLGAR